MRAINLTLYLWSKRDFIENDWLINSFATQLFLVFLNRVFSSFMRAHAQAVNEYRGGEMSTEVVVDRILWTEIDHFRICSSCFLQW
mgnify:CR=1 FL=1